MHGHNFFLSLSWCIINTIKQISEPNIEIQEYFDMK